MGFCSGTEIFDKVAEHVLNSSELSEDMKYSIVKTLIEVLEDHDWDCEQDSEYFRNPIVLRAMQTINPDWDWDDIDERTKGWDEVEDERDW